MSAAAFGILLCTNAPTTPAAAANSAGALAAGGPLYGYFQEALGGASAPAPPAANLNEIRYRIEYRIEDPTQASFDVDAAQPTGLTAGAIAGVPRQDRALAAQYRSVARSTLRLSAPVDATLSDLLTRLHYAFGSGLGPSSDRARQSEREVLLKNSDALVRAKIGLTLGKGWPIFLYADMGAADSALKWQGLAGIRGGHGLDLLGGWRRVTYRFSPGRGFDSLDFDGPFLGVTLAW